MVRYAIANTPYESAIKTILNNDCNISLAKDAINRVSTSGLFVAFFFQIGITP